MPTYIRDLSMQKEQSKELDRVVDSKNRMNAEATPFEQTAINNTPLPLAKIYGDS